MATETSSIDDFLTSQTPEQTPNSPEQTMLAQHDNAQDVQEVDETKETDKQTYQDDTHAEAPKNDETSNDNEQEPEVSQSDEYGNDLDESKEDKPLYTRAEVHEQINQAVRERLARIQSPQQQNHEVNQHVQDNFKYDDESNQTWQQQLQTFVEQTVQQMGQKQMQQQQQQYEQSIQEQHNAKFREGIKRYKDFNKVVNPKDFTDDMFMATRGLEDPAGFVYAASKRAPEEIKRISQIKDPYTQVVEMTRLENKMRQQASTTRAPKPVSRHKSDSDIPHTDDKAPSLDDLIAENDRRRVNVFNQTRRR